MRFKVINILTGKKVECEIYELSQNLSPNCEILKYNFDGTLEAIGFVSYETLSHFANEFAAFIYDNFSYNKSPICAATISAVRDYFNKQVSKQYLTSIVDKMQAEAIDSTFKASNNITDNIIANNILLAASTCINHMELLPDIPSYCLSAAETSESKQSIQREQGNYILKYFQAI
jgi:hypothetical protein